MLLARGIGFLRRYSHARARDYAIFVLFLQTDALDEVAVGVLQDDQLVRDYAVDNLFLFGLRHVIEHGCLVQLVHAPAVPFCTVEHLVHIRLLAAAWILVAGSEGAE